ncbi:MAG: ATP-binding protein [Candidatus Aminicenantes bacterium]|nr:ATP-binding protein [Candidatus Aminicenantes bacterium]
MYIKRFIEEPVTADVNQKMVFIGGPRQCGKTSLAKHLLEKSVPDPSERYLNWDALDDRENIMRERFPSGGGLLVLDEIHKYSRWRQTVKGLYDKRGDELKILVTGSARLDLYRRGGDSLQGRYHYFNLFPFSLSELGGASPSTLQDLLMYGGFPEPFLRASEEHSRRWSRAYRFHLVREDLRDLERVYDLDSIEKMVYRLPDLVGSPLSVNALREDLGVSHQSVTRWLQMLENLYMIFRLYPFGAPRLRAVKKEAKHYHLDWTLIKEEGYRFENMVACHLLKWCRFVEDTEGYDMELRYFRDVDRREVDFVLVKDGKLLYFVECKLKAKEAGRALRYLKERFPDVPAAQISMEGGQDVMTKEGIRLCPAHVFLAEF